MCTLSLLFKSIVDQDEMPIVVCDLQHIIVYMNPSAVNNYQKRGGAALIGRSLLDCHDSASCDRIRGVVAWFAKSTENNKVHTSFLEHKQRDVYMVALRDDDGRLRGYYEKHENRQKDDTCFYHMTGSGRKSGENGQ